ncbi:pyridoxal phosphate-dependent decarboxylase family protein [Flammeovirga kamogawensis]|uniref:Aspartate aminotransferase family protein n=1 Tax=Flammeovirga kamogawensis TaxID=373891 RepID=A0ABX8H0W2_9BACT|nr:pyridoxal-dependent decarboxylase [Flammeovirga kamogawensis]MBB6462351.1 glutamate/tyrosine decarboxylase-like PLP-dependent enzyme [Flammeovirga kamogawensis]QWG09465.1 aspartate aminotransferase family protein [Flammeovirga kamogawensis]TRX64981.1 aspartate aminotransferase family protein [Flammeovirga kamogawensis]
MHIWKKKSRAEIQERIFEALDNNTDYFGNQSLGVPGSHLDSKVFPDDAPFLKEAPFITTLLHNPNHIGCHTQGISESFFKGTQSIERELIEVCGTDILNAEINTIDGYVASGGTEANMQAIWIYRNYYKQEFNASNDEIAIISSEDSHYSMAKASNILSLAYYRISVDFDTREVSEDTVGSCIEKAQVDGKKYFIIIANMMTTMYGSVDKVDLFTDYLDAHNLNYKLHIDGAYGGFFFPFSHKQHQLDFRNPKVTSVTLDAHKMLQAPYGTGVFLIRKDWMHYANTKADYVEGDDFTLIGSRSGANAIAIWMILMTYGPYGMREKIYILSKRADWFTHKLDEIGISYFRSKDSNIVTMHADKIRPETAKRFGLVPDVHHNPKWYKVVVMEHVTIEKLEPLIEELSVQ